MSVDLVYVSAWLVAGMFFWARLHGLSEALRMRLDQSGAVLLWLHILIAYILTHQGSHSAAVAHVAIRTEEAVGVRTGMGIYANFLTAILWPLCAFECIPSRSQIMRRMIDGFLWMMFISASVVFADRVSAILFAGLILIIASSHLFRITGSGGSQEFVNDIRN